MQRRRVEVEEERCRFEGIVGGDPALVEMLRRVARVAASEATVLLLGESGTGKELVARALHANSRRAGGPFVALNCGALPDALLDSELFGHVRGAFTGAVEESPGWLDRAAGGTILLDEVGETSPALQVKLLRVLESREYARLGSRNLRRCDVRILAATHRDLADLARQGRFRQDLLFRIDVVAIALPPLRERPLDVLPLARHFLALFNARHGTARRLSARAAGCLLGHPYPGNVRELQNAIERAVLLAEGPSIEPEDLPPSFLAPTPAWREADAADGFRAARRRLIDGFERAYITRALEEARGNLSLAARRAGLDARSFRRKMAGHGIDPSGFRGRRS